MRPLFFLGVKLTDADFYLRPLLEADAQQSAGGATSATRWRALSRQADAYVFAVYGALDAFTQVAVAVSGIQADEEIKFPALVRLLTAASRSPERWSTLRDCLEAIHQAEWFRRLRYMRNEVNHRSVLGLPLDWPAHDALDWQSTYTRVVGTVEEGLHLLLDPGA
ncbi:MAG: hypothetical protein ACREUA_07605 [Burkholderiales bacterium]